MKCNTSEISKIIKVPENIKTVFHFGEFARIYQSFLKMNECIESNTIGSNAVFNFCLKHKIKLIYSATSASLGNFGKRQKLIALCVYKSKKFRIIRKFKKMV